MYTIHWHYNYTFPPIQSTIFFHLYARGRLSYTVFCIFHWKTSLPNIIFLPHHEGCFSSFTHVYEGLIHVNSTLVRLCHTNRASGKDSSDIRVWLSLFSGLINFFPLWYNNTQLQGGFVILLKI